MKPDLEIGFSFWGKLRDNILMKIKDYEFDIVGRILISAIIIIVLAIIASVGLKVDEGEPLVDFSNIDEVEKEERISKELIRLFNDNKKINDDYRGQLFFESGLIDVAVVQGKTNDTYLRTDWQTKEYLGEGSIFMDANNNIDTDENLIIYGHTVFRNVEDADKRKFSPLIKLTESSNYEENKFLAFFTGDKLLRYEIARVFRVKIIEIDDIQYIDVNEPIYVINNYSEEEFETYLDSIKTREYYQTGVQLNKDDRLITLQTCLKDSVDKLVIVGKLIEEIPVEEN